MHRAGRVAQNTGGGRSTQIFRQTRQARPHHDALHATSGRSVTTDFRRVGCAQWCNCGNDMVWRAGKAGGSVKPARPSAGRSPSCRDGADIRKTTVARMTATSRNSKIKTLSLSGASGVAMGRRRCLQMISRLQAKSPTAGSTTFESSSRHRKKICEPIPDFGAETRLIGTPRTEIEFSDCGAVVLTGGFRPGYDTLIPNPDAFPRHGFPIQTNGKPDVKQGIWFPGVHFVRTCVRRSCSA